MKIAIDLDGTITAYPQVFELFTMSWRSFGHKIYIVTDRQEGTEDQVQIILEECRISYDIIKITGNKADYIIREGIEVLFEDTDEYFLDLPESVCVFKIRELYNFDFSAKKWVVSEKTARM